MSSKPKKEKGDLLWFRMVLYLVPRLVKLYFKVLDATTRKVWLNRHIEEELCDKRSFAAAGYHGSMLYPIYHCRKYPSLAMVSRSWDGEIIARSIEGLGINTVRGSSSKGGKEALREMIDLVKEKDYTCGIAVDAPRGPARKVKIGLIIAARETGQPIVPWVSWTTRYIQFNSWDKMILPLPFGTIVMSYGEPTYVPKGLSNDEYEALRLEVESKMMKAQLLAEEKVKELKEL